MTFWKNPLEQRSYEPVGDIDTSMGIFKDPSPPIDYSDILKQILIQLIFLTDKISQVPLAHDPKSEALMKQLRRINSNLERGLKLPHIPE